MKYCYGVVPNFKNSMTVKVPQLLSMIERDVKQGKWNIYQGGDENHVARVSYEAPSFTYGEHIFIKGSERELRYLEEKLQKIIKVIPRRITNN